MKTLITILALIPCLLTARSYRPITSFMDQDVDCQLVAMLKDKPMAEKINAYCEQKIYLLTQASIYAKGHEFDKEWYYHRGQIDAFSQVMEVFEMED